MTDDEAADKLQAIRLPADFVERGYRETFGETREEAQGKRVLCEPCWDRIMMPPDEPEDG
jgi:hypothetical protein